MSKRLGLLLATGVLGMASLGFWGSLTLQHRIAERMPRLENGLAELRSMAHVAHMRQQNIDKVLAVIDRFNPSMPLDQKLAIADAIHEASLKYDNLDVELICATITHESAFTWDPRVVSHAGALGLMQVMPETGAFLARVEGFHSEPIEKLLFDPVANIRLGTRYLSSLIELYGIDGGLAAYNGGGRRVEMWIAQNRADGVLFPETERYVPAILTLYDRFKN